jgi:uncharacterized membrane protein
VDLLSRLLHAGIALVLAANVVVLLTWPPVPAGDLRAELDSFYAAVCHRLPERCYAPGGETQPACARCLGVWLGLLAAAALAAAGLLRLHRRSLKRAGLLLGILAGSWLLGLALLPPRWHAERTAAGFLGGLGLYVLLWALVRRTTGLVRAVQTAWAGLMERRQS